MLLHTVVISTAKPPEHNENLAKSFLRLVWEGMTEASGHKSRIYRTYVDVSSEDKRFVLLTTSKDLHLKLGSFEWRYHYNFAKFIEEELARAHCSQLLLLFVDTDRGSEEGILVTATTTIVRGTAQTIYTLAPVR